MTASREEIGEWLRGGKERGYTHMVVVCDTFDYDDYPVYVSAGEDVRKIHDKYNGKNMQKVMEVYSYGKDLEAQLNGGLVLNLD